MRTAAKPKEQTAFRFESELIEIMKRRAHSLNVSLNRYVTDLIEKDIRETYELPKVKLPEVLCEEVARYSGIMKPPTKEELESDERLERIWKR